MGRMIVMIGNRKGSTILMLGVKMAVVAYLYLIFQVFHQIKSKSGYIICV